jgi:Asp-tRNA(Asn)/Glu-tRNA(Gln) amidotransferase A subunit family amidase
VKDAVPAADELLAWPAWRQRAAVLAGDVSVVELVTATLERIADVDETVHSFVHVAPESALEAAARLDDERRSGASERPLLGTTVSLKDLFHVAGMPTTAGSLLFGHDAEAHDSVHAARLRAAGAVIVGKTNTPEFGVFPRTVNRVQPETVNPWDLSRITGGSSGGAAASVAAGLTPVAVGSDGGGSIRIPAALCGVAGMLPSRGLVPRQGGIGGTLFFSSAGPVAADARDLAELLTVLGGPLAADPLAAPGPPPDLLGPLESGIAGVRVRRLTGTGVAAVDPDVAELIEGAARSLIAEGEMVEGEPLALDTARWQEDFYAMMSADRYAAVGQQIFADDESIALLSDYGRDSLERGRAVTGADYSRALETRFRAVGELNRLFETTDLLLSPTTCVAAPRVDDPIERWALVAFTNFCNFVGLPAATMPCGFVRGMPVGLQIVGSAGADALVLRACRAFESLHTVVRPPVATVST